MSENIPRLSIGLAVRNGKGWVENCIESILGQDFEDFELVVCDNASDDGTIETLANYARADGRVRLNVNPSNIGLHQNMNRVLRLARGTFFRWISADDWLEPGYLSKCVKTLEDRPDAIGLTTGFTLYSPEGVARWKHYRGEFPSSGDAAQRFERMLWFYHAGDAIYDPIYGLFRRSRLLETGMLRRSEQADWLICAELALMGPIIHIPDRLANRTQKPRRGLDRVAFRRRLDPNRSEDLRTWPSRTCRDLRDIVGAAQLTEDQLRRCEVALRRFWAKETIRAGRAQFSDSRHLLVRLLRGNKARFLSSTPVSQD
ncbi:glycosyltransferase family 2 protein [Mesorhizobium sp. M2D.F.Ca.ET.185.01.1.1]|uniref:glycosyltransferase family 2 protein n=3 Tax=Mesorhizobium TaxID=68287 RepID=UPI000FCA3C07|nr:MULTISPECIES: glycosyltransferase family A protein [unclassified Mesorhizobium]TGP80974.1 glycosyltransferase family 2 protein [bacterium M00.F.Ca.ET.227.01.1.1]TGP90757.1 glycosyltransferase family 2 protein [bacterium M00.F.Ca.ET.221.01.1.1]TGP97436.1 glycosyltransferase family 2 protein [bacterium M00.F.Ca.ET.222.01.1.1]TGU07937.1 glycosyltransferase family 2 protein [bacterium M00.F.Ca.ET.163.01.1.1]TGU33617.1 glycosyltransferase family 2 protein [bacterium M00.F.Ca.ET.156.01.1.1]TGU47